MIIIRSARRSDKIQILSFCSDTFSWGDYIDRVWNSWYTDRKNGRLFVAESDDGSPIALSHAAFCPDKKGVWLEGVRIHPSYRRLHIASRLIEKMIEYGIKKGAYHASAIVAADNIASQNMMKKNGFKIVAKWVYYDIVHDQSNEKIFNEQKSEARLASTKDLRNIWEYLQQSKVYRLSGKRYMKSWHWYNLDHKTLSNFIKEERVILMIDPSSIIIKGIAIINKFSSYWDDKKILQIIYLDTASPISLKHLISFTMKLYADGNFNGLQVTCHNSKHIVSFIRRFIMKEPEQFLLYDKVFRL